jgi:hypothetical protein
VRALESEAALGATESPRSTTKASTGANRRSRRICGKKNKARFNVPQEPRNANERPVAEPLSAEPVAFAALKSAAVRGWLSFVAALSLLGCAGGADDREPNSAVDAGLERAEETRACLADAGIDVSGSPRESTDADAPDVELSGRIDGTQAFIAFYADVARAERFESTLKHNARRSDGLVDRLDAVTIVWAGRPSATARSQLSDCVAQQ